MESVLAKKCSFESTETVNEFVPRMANILIGVTGK